MIYQPGRGLVRRTIVYFRVRWKARLSWATASVIALWLSRISLNICGWVHRPSDSSGPLSVPEITIDFFLHPFLHLVVPIVEFYCIWWWVFFSLSLFCSPPPQTRTCTHTYWLMLQMHLGLNFRESYILSLFPRLSLESKEHTHVQNTNHTHNTVS